MGLSRAVSQIDGDLRRKITNFLTPMVGFAFGILYRSSESKKLE